LGVAAERERCAGIIEELRRKSNLIGQWDACNDALAAIRQGKKEPAAGIAPGPVK